MAFNFGNGAGPTMPREDYEKFFGRSAGLGGMFGAPAENQIGKVDAALRAQKGINYNSRLQQLYGQQSKMRPWELSQDLYGRLMGEANKQQGADYTAPIRDMLRQVQSQTGGTSPAYNELLKELESQRGETRRVSNLPRGFDQKTIEAAMSRIQSQAGRVTGDLKRQLEAKAAATGMGGGALNNAQLLANRDLGRNVSEATSGFMTEAGRAEQQGRFSQADSVARLLGLRGQTAGALGSQSEQSLQYQMPFMQMLAQAGPEQAKLVASIMGQAGTAAGQYGNLMLGQEQQLGGLAGTMAGNVAKHGDLVSNLLQLRGQAAGQRQQANIAGASASGDLAGREMKQYGVEAENYANASAAQQLQEMMGRQKNMFQGPDRNLFAGQNGQGAITAPQTPAGVPQVNYSAQSSNWNQPQAPAQPFYAGGNAGGTPVGSYSFSGPTNKNSPYPDRGFLGQQQPARQQQPGAFSGLFDAFKQPAQDFSSGISDWFGKQNFGDMFSEILKRQNPFRNYEKARGP